MELPPEDVDFHFCTPEDRFVVSGVECCWCWVGPQPDFSDSDDPQPWPDYEYDYHCSKIVIESEDDFGDNVDKILEYLEKVGLN